MASNTKWTKPYCGVQHLKPLPRGWQVTVTNYDAHAEAFVLAPGGGFKSAAEETFDTVEEALAWGARQAQLLIGKAAS